MERLLPPFALAARGKLVRSANQLPSSHCGRSSQVVPNLSTLTPSSKRSPYIVSLAGRDVTWNDLAHSWRIFSPSRDIEKIPAPSRSHISSPSFSSRSGSRRGCCRSSHTYPCKTLFPTIRLTLLGSDFETLKSLPMDQRYYSASNSLLDRTADRTPKTFALQGDPSRSTHTPSFKRSPYIVSRGRL
ncbi:hypothetical protein AVEN_55857-1 [Araneus ventricosus]|uniref:Uncharacterized protein n=1 Tax=Araneus ventricosus TaxID=182803 RepID=A0A4Y2GSL5_ARAVE|nr:hypothetical protein AVEN_55857-1 [Araneus ventricosus]